MQVILKEKRMLIKYTRGFKVLSIAEEYKQGEKEFKFLIHHYYAKRFSTFCKEDCDTAAISFYKTGDLHMNLYCVDNNNQIVDRELLIIPKTFDVEEEEEM